VSANEVIEELKGLSSDEREKVYRWLQREGLRDLFREADAVLKDAPRPEDEEILNFPRVRPPGFQ
jgi:hypothetical protein